MLRNAGTVLMVSGLSLTALAGAATLTASTSVATSVPKMGVSSFATRAQATKPLPPQREESGEDGGSISGKRQPPVPAAPRSASEPGPSAPANPERGRDILVEAPDTYVRVNPNNGRVRVEAPYTFVDVNPGSGRAVVRAPGFSLDLRW